ncbi:MAG TPA: alpha/beta hydrolase [Solirubrobacteraceae bacterium]|nr:alpha/beta hydrolase [Solirubrobacteraceae bacterium]
MPEIEGAGVALHYEERGSGSPVLAIHGMASDSSSWSDALDALADAGARAIAFDRRGYARSGAPEPYVATTVQEQAQDATCVLDGLGAAPALLVAEGFGALVALELLVRRPDLVAGAALADVPLFAFVPAATEALAAQREMLEAALRAGGPAAALLAWLGEDAGAAGARVRGWQRGFFADYAGLASWSPSRRELRAIGVAVAFVTGPASALYVVAASDAAAGLVPGSLRVVDGDVVGAAMALLAPG